MTRRGLILAGGNGTRLHPLTHAVSKQLLPVYDKPMIYYPLTTLMLAGIREILIITTAHDLPRFQGLLGNGEQWGIDLSYGIQEAPNGIAEALLIGDRFIGDSPVALILGDNLFFGHGLTQLLSNADRARARATVFAYRVREPERYGIVELSPDGLPIQIVEKPGESASHLAVTGLYLYPPGVSEIARQITPSPRGELEITDVNRWYLEQGQLDVVVLHRGFAWLDTGTHETLHHAASFVQTVQERQGLLVASPEEVAWRLGYIGSEDVLRLSQYLGDTDYAKYLRELTQTLVRSD